MARRLITAIAGVVLLAVLLVDACDRTPSPGTQSAGPAIPAELQFTAETLDGHQFSGDSLFGKPAVLWFWAPWCPACRAEAPAVARAAAANPAVTFVGVGARDEPPAMKAFVEKYHLAAFTELADTDGAVWAKFGVTRQPAYAFVSPDGAVEVVKGSLAEHDLNDRVRALAGR